MLVILTVLPAKTIQDARALAGIHAQLQDGAPFVERTHDHGTLIVGSYDSPEGSVADRFKAERSAFNRAAIDCWRDYVARAPEGPKKMFLVGHPARAAAGDDDIAVLNSPQYYSWFSHDHGATTALFSPLEGFAASGSEDEWDQLVGWCWRHAIGLPYYELRAVPMAIDRYRSFNSEKPRLQRGLEAAERIARLAEGELAASARNLAERLTDLIGGDAWPAPEVVSSLQDALDRLGVECEKPQLDWL